MSSVTKPDSTASKGNELPPLYLKEEVLAKKLADAACNGRVKEVAKLLKENANVNWAGHPMNQTPLFLAAANGHGDVCKILLAAGAKTDAKQELSNLSPLDSAIVNLEAEIDNLISCRAGSVPEKATAYIDIALSLVESGIQAAEQTLNEEFGIVPEQVPQNPLKAAPTPMYSSTSSQS